METLKTPAFVYFDLGKVLLDFSHEVMCSQMADKLGLSPTQLKESVFESGLSDRYEIGEVDSLQFCESVFELLGTRCDPAELLLAGSDIFSLKSEMIPLVANLAISGIGVGILSNTCPAHWELVEERYAFLTAMFSITILSYEVKARKPATAIYEIAAAKAGVCAEDVFFVDDREDNVKGARSVGYDSHVFRSAQQVQALLIERGVQFNY